MVKITGVECGSRAFKHGIMAGDTLIAINDNEINDVLDYRFYLTEFRVNLLLSREGREFSVEIKKGEYDDVGLEFETPLMDKKHSCKNKCIFCFIDQNPEGLRESLYFKDDDSRLSFIHGNYVTLTNMTQQDVDRIIKMRMSPINISVHTTNPELRVAMMKNKNSGKVLKYLRDFADAGLGMCGQIVLCKGVNDGDELVRSMNDLSQLFPSMSSVAIVPAGLTKFREKLYPLTDFTPEEAAEVIDLINSFGDRMKEKHGTRVFYAADEFYLKSGRELPSADYYEEYPQLENGVGMIRSFLDEFEMALSDLRDFPSEPGQTRTVSIVTGTASYPMMRIAANRLMEVCPGININIFEIINNFFGTSITVSGLLTGKDILEQVKDKPLGDVLLIPSNCLRHGEEVFLCGMSVSELSERLGVPVSTSGADGYELVESILSRQI